jgi:hypothetical protein
VFFSEVIKIRRCMFVYRNTCIFLIVNTSLKLLIQFFLIFFSHLTQTFSTSECRELPCGEAVVFFFSVDARLHFIFCELLFSLIICHSRFMRRRFVTLHFFPWRVQTNSTGPYRPNHTVSDFLMCYYCHIQNVQACIPDTRQWLTGVSPLNLKDIFSTIVCFRRSF